MSRAILRAPSWIERGIFRAGAFGEHRGFSALRAFMLGIAASLSVIRWAIFRRAGDLPLLQGRSEASRPDHDFGGLREHVFRCPVLLPPVSNSVPSRPVELRKSKAVRGHRPFQV